MILLSLVPMTMLGDSWALPRPSAHVSDNAAVVVRVDPGTKPTEGKPAKPAHCRFFRYVEDKKTYEFWKEYDLANSILPVDVVVPDDGSFLVTFDDYMGFGIGDNSVVVYDGKGQISKRWSLKDIYTEAEIDDLPHSSMSILWRGGVGTMAEHQHEVYISPPEDPLRNGKKFKGFMLDVNALSIHVDPRWK